MNVLSLFDGIGCGKVALERVGVKIDKYFASEIKQCAIKCATINNPDIIEIGDVFNVHYKDGILKTEKGDFDVGQIDILIGGSPCQDFSCANVFKRSSDYGLNGDKSRLFYEYLRLKKEIEPKYFLLENVKMKKSSEKELNDYMGVDGIHINSSLVSYQTRPRIYWTNIPIVGSLEDKHISFQNNKDKDFQRLEESKVHKTPCRIRMWNNGMGRYALGNCENITHKDKIGCLTRKQDRSPNSGLIAYGDFCRFLTRREIEGAQTLPVGYTDMLTYRQVQDVCGEGWTIDVIVFLMRGLKS